MVSVHMAVDKYWMSKDGPCVQYLTRDKKGNPCCRTVTFPKGSQLKMRLASKVYEDIIWPPSNIYLLEEGDGA